LTILLTPQASVGYTGQRQAKTKEQEVMYVIGSSVQQAECTYKSLEDAIAEFDFAISEFVKKNEVFYLLDEYHDPVRYFDFSDAIRPLVLDVEYGDILEISFDYNGHKLSETHKVPRTSAQKKKLIDKFIDKTAKGYPDF
jgi:hypothetical protein